MSDIFISYARSTAAQAQAIAQALRALGYGVWRDDELPAHRAYAEVIEERLKAAKAVVVVWSAEAAKSEWVQSEADRARNDRKLVQLSVDGTPLPMPFDRIQCADLSGWAGDLTSPGWRKVVASITDLLGASPAKTSNASGERAGISICVLPFANMSKDEDQEYFSDGISEDIITDLSKVRALTVISRNSAFTFKGKHVDLPEVARQLKVTHVLEGSVRKSGNRVRITAQLIDGATNGHVWAERYDRNLDDIFALQDEISEAIVAALKLSLFPEEKKAIEGRRASNLEVYDKYLRARERFNTAATPPDFARAADMFREALALDPDFAEARGGLVIVFAFLIVYAPERAAEFRTELGVVAKEALARAPDHWTTHLANGCVLTGEKDWLGADAAFTKLAALAPASELPSFLLGTFFATFGRMSEAVSVFEAGRLADPLSIQVSAQLYGCLNCLGRQSEAQAEYERAKDLRGSHEPIEHAALWLALESGDVPAIKAQFQLYLGTATVAIASIQRLFDIIDQPAAALALLKEEFENPANQDSMRMAFIALYAAHFGDTELALAALRRSGMAASFRPLIWSPPLRNVRKTPAFKQLVRDLGFYDYWRKSGKWGDFARPIGDDDFEVFR